jgi:hypothetical protein
LLLILDAATGGKFRPRKHPRNDFSYYGNYNTDGMIPICTFSRPTLPFHRGRFGGQELLLASHANIHHLNI